VGRGRERRNLAEKPFEMGCFCRIKNPRSAWTESIRQISFLFDIELC
jgi:hypothetical protein